MNIIQQYLTDHNRDLATAIRDCTISKLDTLIATSDEMDRMRFVVHQLNHQIFDGEHSTPDKDANYLDDDDHSAVQSPASRQSRTLSPFSLPSPTGEIKFKPLDLDEVGASVRPRRYSQIPPTYRGEYKIDVIDKGNGVDFPYPNDKVTVQYSMFSIDGALELLESYKHGVVDLSSSECMVGLKYGILTMTINQHCKLWIPRRLTAHKVLHSQSIDHHSTDILVDITLINIIRSDVFKDTTYSNDIILNAQKPRRHRANTVSMKQTPIAMTSRKSVDLDADDSAPSKTTRIVITSETEVAEELEQQRRRELSPETLDVDKRTESTNTAAVHRETSTSSSTEFVRVPDLRENEGHFHHQPTDLGLQQLAQIEPTMTMSMSTINGTAPTAPTAPRSPNPVNPPNPQTLNPQSLSPPAATSRSARSPRSPRTPIDDGKSEYAESEHSDPDDLLPIHGEVSMWKRQYGSLSAAQKKEQCHLTACNLIEDCHCTKRLLMVLKVYQSVMYNRKQTPWSRRRPNKEDDDRQRPLVSMFDALTDELGHSPHEVMNDFFHCRFYHGRNGLWYQFCRKQFETGYCVYEFVKCHDGDTVEYKRHCSIYSRYHRDKRAMRDLKARRECFRVLHDEDGDSDDQGLSDEEINEMVTLQICDLIHCFIFHSAQEPHLLHHNDSNSMHQNQSSSTNLLQVTERNVLNAQKFSLSLRHNPNRYRGGGAGVGVGGDGGPRSVLDHGDGDGATFRYDGESFGVMISFKEESTPPLFSSMRDEILHHPTAGLSEQQYLDTQFRAAIFQRTFIGTQMVNFFQKSINLQQLIAVMVYCNFYALRQAFSATLHCHNLDDDELDALRASHCRQFHHWSRTLFSVVDNFGDPIDGDTVFMVRFLNFKRVAMMDTLFNLQSVYSVTNARFVLTDDSAENSFSENDGDRDSIHSIPSRNGTPQRGGSKRRQSVDADHCAEDVVAVIGAQRMGSLYFDASLLSEYPNENEILLGPSQHLEIRNLIVDGYDCQTYFAAIYVMDALIGHRLGFDFAEHAKYEEYLRDVIRAAMRYIEQTDAALSIGQRLCYEYWVNKKQLFWNMRQFAENVRSQYLRSHFVVEKVVEDDGGVSTSSIDEWTVVKAFHFVNTAMLFPNVESIEIQEMDLSRYLVDALLDLVTLLEDQNADVRCGRKLRRVQLCGANDEDRHYLQFMEEDLERYIEHFEGLNWSFDASRTGIWLFTKRTARG